MPTIDYRFGMLATGSAAIHRRVSDILDAVDELALAVNAAKSTWQSHSASDAYLALQELWNEDEEEVRGALARFGQAVGQAGEAMQETERSNTNLLST